MEKHQQNIAIYLNSGGDQKLALRHANPTLENRAKITYLLSQLSIIHEKESELEIKEITKISVVDLPEEKVAPPKPKFLGFITQYPVSLHLIYNECFTLWLQLCSLKLQLNEIPENEEDAAYELQTEMLQKIKRFDRCKKTLDHYLEFKRILSSESKKDFSKMSELELYKEKRKLSSLIFKRKQTIAKMEAKLPKESAKDYRKKVAAMNRKKEQLEELILDEEKLNGLLK